MKNTDIWKQMHKRKTSKFTDSLAYYYSSIRNGIYHSKASASRHGIEVEIFRTHCMAAIALVTELKERKRNTENKEQLR